MISRCFLFSLFIAYLSGCTKQADAPAPLIAGSSPVAISGFHLSTSGIVLLESNAAATAVTFSWNTNTNMTGANFTLEAAEHNTLFADPVEIAVSGKNNIQFTVGSFNDQISKVIFANRHAMVDFRIRVNQSTQLPPLYSDAIAMDVTTYQSMISYPESQIFRLPGNFQDWNLTNAPKIISAQNNEEYEGYVNFAVAYPQLLLVKGTQWDPDITFTYIGAEKFGFGGSMLSVFGGAGTYLFKASTNTNKWSYTKINNWTIAGSAAANTKPVLTADKTGLSWSVTADLVQGSFRINANNDNSISFGQKSTDRRGLPSYDGVDIPVKQDGNYTIRIDLQSPGNYNYSINRNSN